MVKTLTEQRTDTFSNADDNLRDTHVFPRSCKETTSENIMNVLQQTLSSSTCDRRQTLLAYMTIRPPPPMPWNALKTINCREDVNSSQVCGCLTDLNHCPSQCTRERRNGEDDHGCDEDLFAPTNVAPATVNWREHQTCEKISSGDPAAGVKVTRHLWQRGRNTKRNTRGQWRASLPQYR